MKKRHVDSFAPEMRAVVAEVAPLLEEAGFRKRRNAFNRSAREPGLTHMVEFQMGAVWGSHGQFVINYGFDADEVREVRGWRRKSFLMAYEGAGWTRVTGGFGERWFDLEQPVDELVGEVTHALRTQALPLLDQLQTRRDAVAADVVERLHVPAAAVAAMLHHLGDDDEARRVLVDAFAGKHDQEWRERGNEVAKKLFGSALRELGP